MSKTLYYLTYQDFPSNKANSHQTIATCKYFQRNKHNATLLFPLRSQKSNADIEIIKSHYEMKEDSFKVIGLPYNYKFENKKFFKKINYVFKHILWSYKTVEEVTKKFKKPDIFFTRSEWIFYFISRKNLKVVYECHKLTTLRKFILTKVIKKENSKIIFLNHNLKVDSGIKIKYFHKTLVQHSGYDEDYFYTSKIKKKKQVIYAGSIYRLGKNRDLDFVINAFKDSRLSQYNLKIFGGTEEEIKELRKLVTNSDSIEINSRISKKQLGQELSSSEIGILTSYDDEVSKKYTDPLKFYEYAGSGLKILAVDFPSHRELDKYCNLIFYDKNNIESFINALLSSASFKLNHNNYHIIPTQNDRIKSIINFIYEARLEGLEPPTL